MIQTYEHHISIGENKLCPFKVSAPSRSSCVPNWHTNIEIIYVESGNGNIRYGDEVIHARRDDIFVVNSEVLHSIESTGEILYRYIIIDNRFCIDNGIDASSIVFQKKINDPKIKELFFSAIESYSLYRSSPEGIYAASLRLAILKLLVELYVRFARSFAVPSHTASKREHYVKTSLEYLNSHYTDPLSLDELAELSGITKYHLIREFKRFTGQTVFEYLNTLRCKRAEECLMDGMSVTETAYDCGFESLSYFSRTYKRITGISPSAVGAKR